MEHFSHDHLLILNDDYIAMKGDVCRGCNDPIFSCKSYVYSCSGRSITGSTSTMTSGCLRFLLHKTCAEAPPEIKVQLLKSCAEFPETLLIPPDQDVLILRSTSFRLTKEPPVDLFNRGRMRNFCVICGIKWTWFSYCLPSADIFVCLKCAIDLFPPVEDTRVHHPAHTKHSLTLIQTLSSFKCYACKIEENIKDLSYKCTICQFWIHKSCGDAPTNFLFNFHNEHPLLLTFSLPKVYRKFAQYCKLCHETLNRLSWLYYCPKCRFFIHFQCARSNRLLSENDAYYNLVHPPSTDESSLFEQFVKANSTLDHNNHQGIILGTTYRIKDWAHDEHHLQLITISELHVQKDVDEMLLFCDCCVKPIPTDGELFYGCVLCKYFLHKDCAELPQEIEHHLWPRKKFFAFKCSESEQLKCDVCGDFCNGIIFSDHSIDLHSADIKLHIGCAMLPKMIKHESHTHQLTQRYPTYYHCRACGQRYNYCKYGCNNCDFYVCGGCIMKSKTAKHRWDPHPLHLIYDPSMVMDHEHDFNCELCSEDIDTNYWFYHCSDCDLTFHMNCANTNTLTQPQFIGHHGHPLILSSSLPKVYLQFDRFCNICSKQLHIFEWIYYCTTCSFFLHLDCALNPDQYSRDQVKMGVQQTGPLSELNMPPGVRFYPTEEELIVQYLCRKVAGHHFPLQIIAEINVYKFDPWVLPAKAMLGEKEWYFFSPRDRKYPNGSRQDRVAGSGYWKATGADKIIRIEGRKVGIKKTQVFYIGEAPEGTKTNWIMHEYRLSELDDWVLCRISKNSSEQ